MQLLVPKELENVEFQLTQINHPENKPAKFIFLNGKTYHVAKLKTLHGKRSLLLPSQNLFVKEMDIWAAAPFNPLFLVIPKACELSGPASLDSFKEGSNIPSEIWEQNLPRICTVGIQQTTQIYTLDKEKLLSLLRSAVAKVKTPKTYLAHHELSILSLDTAKPLPPDHIKEMLKEYASFKLFASLLPKQASEWLAATYDFTQLQKYSELICRDNARILDLQKPKGKAKRKSTAKPKNAKRPANNRSVMDMFKKS